MALLAAARGSISCCGSLRGTEFEVYWTGIGRVKTV